MTRALFVLFATLAVGCGGGPTHLRVAVEAEPNANQNSPVAIAVLVVYEDDVMNDLSKLTATQWFEQAEQRQRDNPDGTDFDILAWEVMPGQRIKELDLELQGREARGLVFADYYSEGDHRSRFNPTKTILVVLGVSDFTVGDIEEDD
jgi:type VI secretion system protein